jgi:AcrR family transcriptional regulator
MTARRRLRGNGNAAPGTKVASPRQHNRRSSLLAAAARLIAARGYDAISMRDIAAAAGMEPGSLYYHFRSKEELFLAVHEDAVNAIATAVERAIAPHDDPWARLAAATGAHLEALLGARAAIVSPDFPRTSPRIRARLVAQRDAYEQRFARLVDDLDLAAKRERSLLRLMLLGAINWTPRWYRPGPCRPAEIGRIFTEFLAREMRRRR